AYQRGLIPLSAEAILKAIELNGAAVKRNQEAFRRGRAAAWDETVTGPATPETESLNDLVARRVADLTAYQNAAYARRYADFVAKVRAAEGARVGMGEERLGRAVAIQLHRLM